MNVYTQTLNNLLDQQTKELSESEYFFSLYLPTSHKTKIEINQQLKTKIIDYFRGETLFEDKKEIPLKILGMAEKYVDNLDENLKGLSIFIKFNIEKNSIDKESFISLEIPETITENIYAGKNYELDQLINITNGNQKALIISLEQNEANIYELVNGKFDHCSTEKNEMLEYDLKERNKRPSPFSDGQKYFGGGEYTMQRREYDENLNLLNQIMDKITTNKYLKEEYNSIIIFHSTEFNGVIQNFMDSNKSRIGNNIQVILENKTLKDKNAIEKESNKILKRYYRQSMKDLLKNAREEHKHFVEGWDEVAKNSQMKKIEILFLKPSAVKDGFIYDNNFIYTDDKDLQSLNQVEKTKHYQNIVPWLIKNVMESSGKIVLLKNLKLTKGANIAAKLRY